MLPRILPAVPSLTRCPLQPISTEEGKEEILKVTFEELRQHVALYAAAMRKMGVRTGDRVVGESLFPFSGTHPLSKQ